MAHKNNARWWTFRPLFYAAASFIFVVILTQYLSFEQYQLTKDEERKALQHELSNVKDRLRSILYSDITAASTLAILYSDYTVERNFDSIARQIVTGNQYIDRIQITENGIIKHVYPLEGYEQTIGLNTYTDSMRVKEEHRAFEKSDIYFTGPRKLRQGGEGILGKVPVMINGRMKGMVVVLTTLQVIKNALELNDSDKRKFAYELLKKNANGVEESYLLTAMKPSRAGEMVYADIPEGDWQLGVTYDDNFSGALFPNPMSMLGLLLSVISSILVYRLIREPHRLRQVVSKKTNLLGERVKELSTIYKVNKILQDQKQTADEVFLKIVKLLPSGWQYPEICVARITFDGKSYCSEENKTIVARQVAEFSLLDGRNGSIEIGYVQQMPEDAEGPFLREERDLINSLVETIEIYFDMAAHQYALEQSEARFRGAFEHAAIGMAIVSLKGEWIQVNEVLCAMVGYTMEEMMALTFQDITYTEDLDKDLHFLQGMLKGEIDFYRIEKRYIHKNNAIVWVNLNVAIIKDSDCNPLYFVSQIENITERVESQLKFRNLVEKSLVGVYILQGNNFVYVNPRVAEESGYTEEELLSMPVESFIFKDDLLVVYEKIRARIAGEIDEVRYEIRVRKKDGSTMWLELFGSATIFQGASAIIGTMVNITEKKAVYNELVKSEANLRSVFDNSEIMYMLLDTDYNIVDYNKRMQDVHIVLSDWKMQIGDNIIDELIPEKGETAKRTYDEVVAKNKPVGYETAYKSSNGIEYFMAYVAPISFDGIVNGLCVSGIEISKIKNLEFEREKMIADLVSRNRDLQEFAQMVSHNLRGPLSTILGLTNMLEDNHDEEDKEFIVSGIGQTAQKLDAVVQEMNNILQVKNKTSEERTIVNLYMLSDEIKNSLKDIIDISNAQINCNFYSNGELFTIRSYMHTILHNLISNSLKYRHNERLPVIEIWSKEMPGGIKLGIRDNGTGIDLDKHKDKLFDLNRKFDTRASGRGLGLFMVKAHVDVLGGSIDVKSIHGEGTEFIVTIPVHST